MKHAMRTVTSILPLIAAAILAGCAAPGQPKPELGTGQVTPEMVLNQSPLAEGATAQDFSDVDILEVVRSGVAGISRGEKLLSL